MLKGKCTTASSQPYPRRSPSELLAALAAERDALRRYRCRLTSFSLNSNRLRSRWLLRSCILLLAGLRTGCRKFVGNLARDAAELSLSHTSFLKKSEMVQHLATFRASAVSALQEHRRKYILD